MQQISFLDSRFLSLSALRSTSDCNSSSNFSSCVPTASTSTRDAAKHIQTPGAAGCHLPRPRVPVLPGCIAPNSETLARRERGPGVPS